MAVVAPIAIAATSPYLAYRDLPYIVGGFAGILCLSLLVLQPLLVGGYMPGLDRVRARRWHRCIGSAIILCVLLHVGGLYLASPEDTLDALLLVAPTPFSLYGVIAMGGVLVTGLMVALRHRLGLSFLTWSLLHNALALIIVVSTVIHALWIEGAMEIVSKWALCLSALLVTSVALVEVRVLKPLARRRRPSTDEGS